MASNTSVWLLLTLGACACLASCSKEPPPPTETPEGESEVNIEETVYGQMPDGRDVHLYTMTNSNGMRVKLTDYGAITVGVEVPDSDGNLADVTLGYDTLEGWLGSTSYFGATVGRYANRIAKGKFELDGKTYRLATNDGENHLHGGIKGFDKRLWDADTPATSGSPPSTRSAGPMSSRSSSPQPPTRPRSSTWPKPAGTGQRRHPRPQTHA